MNTHHHVLLGPSMTVQDFCLNFENKEAQDFGVVNGDLDFVVDGWAASAALVREYPFEDDGGDEEMVRQCLLGKKIHSNELGMESLAMLKNLPPGVSLSRYEAHVDGKLSSLWHQVCNSEANPREHFIRRRVHENGDHSDYEIRTHKPLPLPWTLASHPKLIHTEVIPGEKPIGIPKSAIFFTSRLHRLRELETARLHAVRSAKEYQSTQNQIYSVILSMCLYMSVVIEETGLLDFYVGDWIEVFRAGTITGSEIFGTAGGFGANGRFLVGYKSRMGLLIEGAVNWWCPNHGQGTESQQWADEEERKMLRDAIKKMMKELFEMFKEMHKKLEEKGRLPEDAVKHAREFDIDDNSFLPTAR